MPSSDVPDDRLPDIPDDGVPQDLPDDIRPFRAGEQVRLEDPKGRHHLVTLEPGRTFHTHRGGVALDEDLLTAKERQELPFYREVMTPLRLRSTLVGLVKMRGEVLSCVYLGWTSKHRPSERTHARLHATLPLLALGERVHLTQCPSLPVVSGLSPRESEILCMLTRGLTNLEIAQLLGTAPSTVKNQVSSLFRKTGTSNRSELAFWAASHEPSSPRR